MIPFLLFGVSTGEAVEPPVVVEPPVTGGRLPGRTDAAKRQALEVPTTQPEADPYRDVDWSLVQRRLEASLARDRQRRMNTQKLMLLMAA